MRVLFLCAHADDSEFCCGNTELMLAKKYEVVIACMTADEYGTKRDDFKGKRISLIREKEMERAAKIVGAKLDWLGFIDGYLPFNRRSFNVLNEYIHRIKPDVVFAPEPLFTLDFHTDHVNTGKLIYLVLKQMEHPPLLLYFHSFKTNYYVPCLEWEKPLEALSCHVSQGMARRGTHLGWKLYRLIYGFFTGGYRFGEGYRVVRFKPTESSFSPLRKLMFWISRAFNKISLPKGDRYKPTPKELGLI
ncbi:MAG: PIG-L family deacetylase [Candidatus Helarchaeota archaeon]|nr:PIG-L family deacetylase [Candidatus Helarchaeota archaeon]